MVAFAAKSYKRRNWEVDSNQFNFTTFFLNDRPFKTGNVEKWIFLYRGVNKVVKEAKPDIVVSAGFSFGTVKLIFGKIFYNYKLVIWTGSVENGKRRLLRNLQRKISVKLADGFIAYGSWAREYLKKLGAPINKISIALNTVDTDFFLRIGESRFKNQRSKDRIDLTFVGYLVPRKNVRLLLDLFDPLATENKNIHLNIIGDGIQKEFLINYSTTLHNSDRIHFWGYKQKEELVPYFEDTDIFLFQTDFDIWGLVLNETMAAGIPCIASKNAGSSHDLISDGDNGFIVDFKDSARAQEIIKTLLDDDNLRKSVGRRAMETINSKAGLSNMVNSFLTSFKQL